MLELQKIRKDINWLIEQIKCLMNKSDLTTPLSATEWSTDHSVALGNPYILDSFVWFNGHVYKSLIDNNQYPPTNATYWDDLGEGHLLLEEQSDWDATSGRGFIRNKPLVSNVDQNNKVIYFYPTLAELGVLTLEEVTETHIATWIQNEGILIAEDEIPLFKVQLILYPIPLYPVGLVNPNIFSTSPEFITFYATEVYPLSTDTATAGATIYADKKGTVPFQGDSNGLNYVNFWRAFSDLCWYKINPSGVVIEGTCGRT